MTEIKNYLDDNFSIRSNNYLHIQIAEEFKRLYEETNNPTQVLELLQSLNRANEHQKKEMVG